MLRTSISVLAFCSLMAASAAQARYVNVPLPPIRPDASISSEAPLEVVRADDLAIPGKNVQDIIQTRHSRAQPVDPIQTLNDRDWNWRHRVGYRADFDHDCVTALQGGTQNTSPDASSCR